MAVENALVLGGGGVAGIAWMTGLLAGLADVIVTVAMAMSGIPGDVGEARSHLGVAPRYRSRAVQPRRAGVEAGRHGE